MKNNTNIYDIDGKLLRAVGDNTPLTLEQAQERSRYYQDKIKELEKEDPNNPKISVYHNYIDNLAKFIFAEYSKLTPEQLKEIFKPIAPDKTEDSEIQKTIEELKKSLENDGKTEENTSNEVSEQSTGDRESDDNKESGNDGIEERSESTVQEERGVSQGDLLVEREGVTNNMDEYVEYEEV